MAMQSQHQEFGAAAIQEAVADFPDKTEPFGVITS